jgi:tRNA pseudouridine32 synthase / 23S rRNA pseudouridine746 synthase
VCLKSASLDPVSSPQVLHIDESILVVVKPAGLLAVPGKDLSAPNLADQLRTTYGSVFVVHRLDQATSGLMVFARNKACERELSKQFQLRAVEKRYVARVSGAIECVSGEINLPLIADWPNRPKQMVDHKRGKPSATRWCLIGTDSEQKTSLLQLTPVTGRTHQLRVHLAAIGHPIMGDRLYGGVQAVRLMLHAQSLAFVHPVTGEQMQFECAADFW